MLFCIYTVMLMVRSWNIMQDFVKRIIHHWKKCILAYLSNSWPDKLSYHFGFETNMCCISLFKSKMYCVEKYLSGKKMIILKLLRIVWEQSKTRRKYPSFVGKSQTLNILAVPYFEVLVLLYMWVLPLIRTRSCTGYISITGRFIIVYWVGQLNVFNDSVFLTLRQFTDTVFNEFLSNSNCIDVV